MPSTDASAVVFIKTVDMTSLAVGLIILIKTYINKKNLPYFSMVIPTSLVIKHFYIFRIATGLEDKLHFIKMLKQYPLHGPTHRGTRGIHFPWSLKKLRHILRY